MEQFLETFFSWFHFKESFPSVFEGFRTNLSLMFVAEACVLVWGMVLVLLRVGRGTAAAGRWGSPRARRCASWSCPRRSGGWSRR